MAFAFLFFYRRPSSSASHRTAFFLDACGSLPKELHRTLGSALLDVSSTPTFFVVVVVVVVFSNPTHANGSLYVGLLLSLPSTGVEGIASILSTTSSAFSPALCTRHLSPETHHHRLPRAHHQGRKETKKTNRTATFSSFVWGG